jgi:hypothetical protein
MMKFFTPELFADYSSDDPAIAAQAEAAWEAATAAYHKHVKHIRKQLPVKVRELAENFCFHDARYLGISKIAGPFPEGGLATITLQQRDDFVFLCYLVVSEPTVSSAPSAKVFDAQERLWLYDEVDIAANGVFSQEILLSNGKIVGLKFISFDHFVVESHHPAFGNLLEGHVVAPGT